MFTLHMDGQIQEWPENHLPSEVAVWKTIDDGTGKINYFARWDEKIFVEITKIMFESLLIHIAATDGRIGSTL